MYAPMGHALGLGPVAQQLEDRCFQVCAGRAAGVAQAPQGSGSREAGAKTTRRTFGASSLS